MIKTTAVCSCLLLAYVLMAEWALGSIQKLESVDSQRAVVRGSRVCSPGWVEGPGSCCFRFISASVTWSAAKNICQEQLGGRLAVLDTYTKNAFIIGNLAILSRDQHRACWWIGARRINGRIQWLDQNDYGYDMSYTFWNANQPDDHLGIEDFVHICKYNYNGGLQHYGWNDDSSDRTDNFICEKIKNNYCL